MKPAHALLGLATALACTAPSPDKREPEPASLGHHSSEPPTFPAVTGDQAECQECTRNDIGQCRLERLGYCPGGPKGTHEACEYEVECPESCCKRFPLVGGVALVRPGRSVWDFGYQREPVEVARVPTSSRGLLVRVMSIYDDHVQVRTIGAATPKVCTKVVDDLRGAILWLDVKPSDLSPVPKACSAAAYAIGDLDNQDYALHSDGTYELEFDPASHGEARVVKARTPVDFPLRPGDQTEFSAGVIIDFIELPKGEPVECDRSRCCYRLPGILRPRLCSPPKAVHNAPQPLDE
ncbi:hypothetical protein DB30_07968 [Enhygromyxa salina]|uniref:Uncharacterized protein n=1 Tax=Enhygromyxa salina TaxID=215803 RepID=A0A0C2CVB0_9BACT|nr:hypothetical protein [Enhygromyxa salina]KIG13520.1 hypothetical protein DB30_07968 [Enhygromyxa salina]